MKKYKTMTALATETLKEGIIDGTLKPDEILVPQNLEERFGLGKMAFREAIRELVGLGLVKNIPNKGSFVASLPSFNEIKEIFAIRFIVEKKVAMEGATHLSEEGLAKMISLHTEMEKESLSTREYFNLNTEFHLTLYQASGLEYLCHLITVLIEYVYMYRYGVGFLNSPAGYNRGHELILNALKSRKPKDVGDLIEQNIKTAFNDIQKHMVDQNIKATFNDIQKHFGGDNEL